MELLIGIPLATLGLVSLFMIVSSRPKNYTVLVLGPTASGKTVFLASMYRKLYIQRPETGFYIRAEDHEQEEQLDAFYNQIEDTKQDFPRPTLVGETTEYRFRCCVQSGEQTHSVLRFTYLDYAGEKMMKLFNNPDSPLLKSVDVLLGIIDGQKLLAFMRRENTRLLSEGFPQMLRIMNNSNKPVHFIITKWDLLEDHFSFKDVLTRLREYDDFNDFIENKISHDQVRLIPVSSVGSGFAKLGPQGMVKESGAIPKPFQVEMPLACILPDQFEFVVKRSNTTLSRLIRRFLDMAEPGISRVISYVLLYSLIVLTLIWALFTQRMLPFSVEIIGPNLEWGSHPPGSARLREQDVHNKNAALKRTVNKFLNLRDQLEKRFPESNLSRHFSE